MVADPRIPATAPTTQAAPKLGRSIAAIVRHSTGTRKSLASFVSPRIGPLTLTAVANASAPCRSNGPFVAVSAMRSQQRGAANLALFFSLFSSDCPLKSVASIQTRKQSAAGNARNSRPFSDGSRLALHRVISTNTSVAHLNRSSGPAAVIRRVWTVVVDAVERHLRPWLAHVSKEVLELRPTLADRDSTPSVVAEEAIVGVGAPLPHPVPNTMHPTAAHAVRRVRLVKRRRSRGRPPFVLASTRDDLSVAQMPPAGILLSATVASNSQKPPVIWDGNHRQQSEPRSRRHINSLDHLCTLPHTIKEGKRYAF
jgi:hypothetical protein